MSTLFETNKKVSLEFNSKWNDQLIHYTLIYDKFDDVVGLVALEYGEVIVFNMPSAGVAQKFVEFFELVLQTRR